MQKAPDAFRTISEVADDLDVPQHVLRFWETRFTQIKPMKRSGGRRYYRPDDVALLRGIRHLLYGEGYTIRGVQRILREQGIKSLQRLAGLPVTGADGAPLDEEAADDLMLDGVEEAEGEDDADDLPEMPVANAARAEPVAPPIVKAASALHSETDKFSPKRAVDMSKLRAALEDLNACRAMLADALKAERGTGSTS